MEKRVFKDSNDMISLLGFGLMRLPKIVGRGEEIDKAQALKMVDYAYEHGVNYFDTAWPYHNGLSETFAGEALSRYPRDSYYLATKVPLWGMRSKDDAPQRFEEQLKKCRVDYFDFYLVHNLTQQLFETCEKFGVYEYLAEEKRRGRIRRLGFSFHDTPKMLEKIVAAHDWDFAQIQLNYLDWEDQDAKRQYEILTEAGIPVIVMEPVRGGTLATLTDDVARIFKNSNPDQSLASWALRYAASLPGVLTVLSGMSAMEHVTDNVQTMSNFKPLNDQERGVIQAALNAYRKLGAIPCTGCRYCIDCPVGVDIPGAFSIYNDYKASGNMDIFSDDYDNMQADSRPDQCIACGACMEHCPQSIDIPSSLKDISALLR